MKLAVFERMEILGKAARVFSGIPVERSDNTGTPRMIRSICQSKCDDVAQAPKIRETFAVPMIFNLWGKIDLSEKSDRFIVMKPTASQAVRCTRYSVHNS